MKRIFWDVVINTNEYRLFTTGLLPSENLAIMDMVETTENFGEKWHPLKLVLWEDKKKKPHERRKSLADFMGSGIVIPAVSSRSRMCLEAFASDRAEFLPFESSVGLYYGLHVKYVNCLDTSKSIVKHFDDGRIMRVVKYAFYWEYLEDVHIFRLPELGLSRLFVSDEFKNLVEENGLTGLEFYPVPLSDDDI